MGRLLDLMAGAVTPSSLNVRSYEKNEINEKTPRSSGVNSFISYIGTPERAQTRLKAERAGWDASDWRAFFGERAAIREYDGMRPRAEAERLAWGETLVEWHRANASPAPSWQCAGCGEPHLGASAMTLPDAARVHDMAGYGCLIAYGKRWRATATAALAAMGIEPLSGVTP
jgi:hypothetical protein